jgi:NO-binding membrane sensor protein with MHYT domain
MLPVLTVHNFSYGLLTPGLGFLMSCLGSFLGLRCATRARAHQGRSRVRWLLLAAVSIGAAGIWTMHFIAMLGFTIPGEPISYNVPITILSLLVAVGIVFTGLLIVGMGQVGWHSLLAAGIITGAGVAIMHYLGMAAMRMPGRVTYDPGLMVLSVVIAIVAATAALWAALRLRGVWATLGAAVIMGVAVSGMHYTGMAAMRMYAASGPSGMVMGGGGGATPESFLRPLILGISIVSFVLTATIALSPTEDEIRSETDLMNRIGGLSSGVPERPPPAGTKQPVSRPAGTAAAWDLGPAPAEWVTASRGGGSDRKPARPGAGDNGRDGQRGGEAG